MSRPLSPRRKQIVACLTRGLTSKEIAAELGIAPGSVKQYIYLLGKAHPEFGSRLNIVRHAVRDHERKQAIRLDEWIKANEATLSEDALSAIRSILADQVADILK